MSDKLRDKLQAAYMMGLGFGRCELKLDVKAPRTYVEAMNRLGWERPEVVLEDLEKGKGTE